MQKVSGEAGEYSASMQTFINFKVLIDAEGQKIQTPKTIRFSDKRQPKKLSWKISTCFSLHIPIKYDGFLYPIFSL
jgi:hypothetical protein